MSAYIPPAVRAQNLLSDLGINQLPTPVVDICKSLNIKCLFDADIDAEALIVKGGKRKTPVIAVKANRQYESRARFSVAHELGHFCIPDHLDEKYICTDEDLNNYRSDKTAEREANEFAAELLIPTTWVVQAIKHQDVTLQAIKTIAGECETSLTSTALQVASHCPDRIAVVYSQNDSVIWFKKAKSFDLYPNTGKLSRLSIAALYFQPNPLILEKKATVPLHAWTYDDRRYEYLVEESLFMPYLNAVLTILTIPCDEFEEDAEDKY